MKDVEEKTSREERGSPETGTGKEDIKSNTRGEKAGSSK